MQDDKHDGLLDKPMDLSMKRSRMNEDLLDKS